MNYTINSKTLIFTVQPVLMFNASQAIRNLIPLGLAGLGNPSNTLVFNINTKNFVFTVNSQ